MKEEKNKSKVFFASVFGLVLSVVLVACGAREEIYIEEPVALESVEEVDFIGTEVGGQLPEPMPEPTQIYVQVCGAVLSPGVYALDAGSRVFEAVALAGGMTDSGDLASLNQAELLTDGQMVYVMTIEEAEKKETDHSAIAEDSSDGKVNINTAGASELATLPGIGTAKAESILAWRQENGAFQAPEDLMKITGIKDGVYSKIKDKIKI